MPAMIIFDTPRHFMLRYALRRRYFFPFLRCCATLEMPLAIYAADAFSSRRAAVYIYEEVVALYDAEATLRHCRRL